MRLLYSPQHGDAISAADKADFVQRTQGLPFLIDIKASSHLLDGNAATQLGYGGYDASVVPDTGVTEPPPDPIAQFTA